MTTSRGASLYSVYLGRGLYIGRVVVGGFYQPNGVEIHASNDAAFVVEPESAAAKYVRQMAVTLCHAARRSGLRAYLVPAQAVAVEVAA